ncbi:betaine-aldehyde dehydrogenase [Aspergillus costaricaensis CBS 115574]|uniref:Betaine-aldehyde dehydrogenase n=1 Tax=Aspergillus costaricaensis CBS 115574 TaxID=1448317 RepID=A0ACD1I6J6_9EURO|nr:betaine-aldehyde dehydrogenase [Aspergillus costaricaensis CBS 115574]RAK86199.1 betaine-aldehyde dehydrogenase [Aspergillus costaricaensis CBS 115574]
MMIDNTQTPIETRLFINGEFRPSSDDKTFPVINPFTQELAADVHEANKADVSDAVAGAKAAFPAWRDLSPTQRGKYFHKLASLIREHEQELARLEALSSGKPVSRYIDASVAADAFCYFAEAGWTVQGSSSWNTPGQLNITSKEPYGVVAAIIPWNVPFAFFGIKIAPALAAGNTIVLKSSEKAPLTCAFGAKLIAEAGFPPGVVNVLSGYGPTTGAILASHMEVRCLSFTGSTLTGRKIQSYAALSNMKTVHAELGGKTPAIIFPDADLESAAAQTSFSIQIFSGQTCNANSRIYVHESVADKFLGLFKSMFGAAVLGNPLDNETTLGPQVDQVQYERVKSYLLAGEKEGELTLGGDAKNGYFIKPTVFENTPEDAQIMKEEIFGPVVVINTFRTEEEVLAKANDSEYGLYAAVFTRDIDRAVRVSKLLEAGTVGVNCTSPCMPKDMPFGGFKGSGMGRESFLHSMDGYLETKAILIQAGS